jgi:hypothetical protein
VHLIKYANYYKTTSRPKRSPAPISSGPVGAEAVNKFGNAKSISSDMYFGGDDSSDKDANLNRFQGSNSISSDMYFNREGVGMSKSQSYSSNMQVTIRRCRSLKIKFIL